MAYQPYEAEVGCKYTLTSPTGVVATFNDPSDANYVGMLTGVSGLDAADVRESAEDLTEADGGAHGNFYMSRRSIVLEGRVFGHSSISERRARIDKMMRASIALRGDAVLSWTNTGSAVPMQTWVRRQQKVQVNGGWVKDFQLPLVSEYGPLFSQAVNSFTEDYNVAFTVENKGSYPAYPIIEIEGPATNPSVFNSTMNPDGDVDTTGLTLASGEVISIDTLTHSATFIAGARNGQNANRYIDYSANLYWPTLLSGNNNMRLTGGGGGIVTVRWRDTWA